MQIIDIKIEILLDRKELLGVAYSMEQNPIYKDCNAYSIINNAVENIKDNNSITVSNISLFHIIHALKNSNVDDNILLASKLEQI